jgi:CBS domain-containing protein
VRISDVLANKGSDVVTLESTATVRDLLAVLSRHGIGAVLVSADGRLPAGLVSERDIVRQLHVQSEALMDRPVEEIMTTEVVVCSPSDQVTSVLQTMTEQRFRHMPVMADGAVVGMVSIGDLVKSRIDELALERDQLSNYITGAV